MINKIKPCVLVVLLIALFSCSKEDGKRNGGNIYVEVNVFPEDGGSIRYYPDDLGEKINLYAEANNYFYFEKWSGDVNSIENPISVFNSSMNITAYFKPAPKIIIQQIGEGEVSQIVHKDTVTNKFIATLKPYPSRYWEFTGWSGDIESKDDSLSIVLEPDGKDKNIIATFVELEWEFDAPEIKSLTFSPEEVDVTNSSQVVTVKAHVTDKSRVNGTPEVCIEYPNHETLKKIGKFQLISGTVKDGIYVVEIIIPQGTLPEEWKVYSNSFYDVFNNSSGTIYPTSDKKTLTVINTKYNTPTN